MSKKYDEYLKSHIDAVRTGYLWIRQHIDEKELKETLPDMLGAENEQKMLERIRNHDVSKYSLEEYQAYDDYFYGNDDSESKSEEVDKSFNYAWLHHIHSNPHHWQYWVLIHDDHSDEQVEPLEMPDMDILEMICDWWSFSWRTGNLYEVFDWYDKNREGIIFNTATKSKVEKLLNLICVALNDLEEE